MQKTTNKTYSAEFKAAAVKQANESELPVSETARNLGGQCQYAVHLDSKVQRTG